MKRTYLLCLVTLSIIVGCWLIGSAQQVRAQQALQIRVEKVNFTDANARVGSAPVLRRIVGFQCVAVQRLEGHPLYGPPVECYVASSD
jgi:hypothetical protein